MWLADLSNDTKEVMKGAIEKFDKVHIGKSSKDFSFKSYGLYSSEDKEYREQFWDYYDKLNEK